ncbi:hypothetical protein [Massilia sp. KIM]|uniref:hypothetical protein n=1 Tax=Massilia sp. KIM TaxID=1955422 RepID=UPI0015C2C46A|nr:hypothetical protein [Massilia sp. KIM]
MTALSLCGCVTVEVFDQEKPANTASPNGQLTGIPFFEKELVNYHETKRAVTDWQIQVTVFEEGNEKPLLVLPSRGPALFVCVPPAEVRRAANQIVENAGWSSPDEARTAVERQLAELGKHSMPDNPHCEEVLSNQTKHEVRPGRKLYVRNVAPLFGSASADFGFAADGTLTSASSSAQPIAEGSNVSNLIPMKEFFTKQWALSSPGAKALNGGTPPPVTRRYEVAVAVQPVITVYTLRRNIPATGSWSFDPIPRADATKAGPSAELVSVERLSDGGGKANPKAYQIQGAIVPPDAGQK